MGTSAVLKRVEADAAIVTEPTEMRLCLAHKGFAWLDVETRGVAAHGSRPDLGVDAVAHMGRILTGVLELDQHLRAGRGHLLLGTGTVHASLIEGGQELSTYPSRCVVKLERRTIPGEDGAKALQEIEALIASARAADPALEATVKLRLERPPSQLGTDSFVTEAVEQAATEVLGRQPEVIGVAYWMDMALSNAVGIPTVAFGPSGEGAHADVEWVDVASLETCVEVYLQRLRSAFAGAPHWSHAPGRMRAVYGCFEVALGQGGTAERRKVRTLDRWTLRQLARLLGADLAKFVRRTLSTILCIWPMRCRLQEAMVAIELRQAGYSVEVRPAATGVNWLALARIDLVPSSRTSGCCASASRASRQSWVVNSTVGRQP